MKQSFLFFTALILVTTPLWSQSDTLQAKDSVNSALLNDYKTRWVGAEQLRIQDSIKKTALENRIRTLSTADSLQKQALEKQLYIIKKDEAARLAEKKRKIDALRSGASAYPVPGFFTDTLFSIYSKLGSFSARDRADAISKRILLLKQQVPFTDSSLQIATTENTVEIRAGEMIIISISEDDALWNNTTPDALARQYAQIITQNILRYKKETSLLTLAKEIGLAILVLLILAALLFYTGKLFGWTAQKIREQENKFIKGLKIKNYTLFDAGKQTQVLLYTNTIVKWMFFLFLLYIALPILFGIFPWTKNFSETLFGYIVTPVKKMTLAIWTYLPNLITIIIIVIIFRYVIKALHFLKSEIENGKLQIAGFYADWANPTYQILRVLVYAFMFILIFPYLPGSESPIFRGVSVFLGFLFTFGSAGSLSNIVAGLVLTYMRLFKIGDRIKIGDNVGDVIEKSLLVTRIRTIKNEIISIPNSTVMSGHTINYSSEAETNGLILHTTVTIGYDVPWLQIHTALLTAADRTPLLLKNPAPFVLQTSLEDFYVSYQINAYTREAGKQAIIYSELHRHIQDCCNEVGIEIMSPHYFAARDGNTSTIPADYLGKEYTAPGFKVVRE